MVEISNIETKYDHLAIEDKIYSSWEEKRSFAPLTEGTKDNFSIVMPPPNVTGILHMGHALDNTLQDILTRWHRMRGQKVLWVPGKDHAGIATQNVVEKRLTQEGTDRHQLGRVEFIKKVWQWKEEHGDIISRQLRKLGVSCDWEHERFTMDDGCSAAVKEVFISLYNEGLIYRGKKITNWCPRCHTALSDVEVEHEDQQGKLWHFKYPIKDETDTYLIVATTRPETMLGDSAVAVNPDDSRYSHLIGKTVILPLVEREIPIIADNYVDKEFGSGAVKITPAHDPNDHEIALRHGLEIIIVMDENARMTGDIPAKYLGQDRYQARKIILEDLQEKGLLEGIDDYDNSIGHCYRCETVIEPYLSDQWFVNMQQLKMTAIKAVQDGKINFNPQRWTKVYLDWMENLRDWCISRQIWWGHRIPVFYCDDCGKEFVSKDDPDKCPDCESTNIRQEEDVLDTWFSSALWPFSTLGWPEQTEDLKDFYPTSVLVTGYDIITFWVSRMIMMGLKFMGNVPFQEVFIHGLIRDESGRKMSKSTGNAVDPLEMIEKHGADSLRFTLASMVTAGGQDLKLSESKIIASRNFMNKLWNVSRYFQMKKDELSTEKDLLADRWIRSRFARIVTLTNEALESHHFGEAVNLLYDFIWGEFCDWYVEMSKIEASAEVSFEVLQGILKLAHPFIPFVTEQLWELQGFSGMLINQNYPDKLDHRDEKLEKDFEVVMDIIRSVRNIRAEMNIPVNREAEIMIYLKDEQVLSILDSQILPCQRDQLYQADAGYD